MKKIKCKETKKMIHIPNNKNANNILDEKQLHSGEKVISDKPVLIRRSTDNELKSTRKKTKSLGMKSGSHSLTALQSFRSK